MLLFALISFLIGSTLCGASTNMTMLIVCRAFSGIVSSKLPFRRNYLDELIFICSNNRAEEASNLCAPLSYLVTGPVSLI